MSTAKHPVLDQTEPLRAAANRQQLGCLESTWLGWNELHRFVCSKGHVFLKTPRRMSRSQESCQACIQDRFTERVHAIALEAGVTWLDEQWLGYGVPHNFRCSQGHTWQRKSSTMGLHPDCSVCKRDKARNLKGFSDGLTRLQQIAAQHGGVCLADAYTSTRQRYGFRCAQGHVWESLGVNIMGGAWCHECAIQPRLIHEKGVDGLARLREVAERHGGLCLDQEYLGVKHHYRFRCDAGHEWTRLGSSALHGSWCVNCHLKAKTLTLDDAHRAAAAKGGQCLSTEYVNAQINLQWQCQNGHRWFARMGGIRQGGWCKRCPKSRLSLDDAHQAARERGGECLSTAYENCYTKMHWLCGRGHGWHTSLAIIRNGHWCPECSYMAKVTTQKTMKRYLSAK
jgi:ssDNA-binding Zn-finger/Zn-ribbon topoisomerase 1